MAYPRGHEIRDLVDRECVWVVNNLGGGEDGSRDVSVEVSEGWVGSGDVGF